MGTTVGIAGFNIGFRDYGICGFTIFARSNYLKAMLLFPRISVKRLAILAVGLGLLAGWCWWAMIRMPLESFRGPLPPLTPAQTALRDELQDYVWKLAGDIGMRHVTRRGSMNIAADYIEAGFAKGGHKVARQDYTAAFEGNDERFHNVEVEIPGMTKPDEIVIIGAHYDSQRHGPGADDNASGVAALFALERLSAIQHPARTVRFVAFANEEFPFCISKDMGSYVYAQHCRERGENITAMISLESIGYYDAREHTQAYPFPISLLYPTRADFIAFVSRTTDASLVRRCLKAFRMRTQFPSEGTAPPVLVRGISLSDHWSFWKAGYSAIMVTDTTRNRSPHFHNKTDTPDTLDYDRMARVVDGLGDVVDDLANH